MQTVISRRVIAQSMFGVRSPSQPHNLGAERVRLAAGICSSVLLLFAFLIGAEC
jgi:hypothetical protein